MNTTKEEFIEEIFKQISILSKKYPNFYEGELNPIVIYDGILKKIFNLQYTGTVEQVCLVLKIPYYYNQIFNLFYNPKD